MGEIGIPLREYLYRLDYCDLILISRGYFKRQRTSWMQSRWIAYQVRFCMGVKPGESAPTMEKWVPFSWEQEQDDDTDWGDLPNEEEIADMYEEIAAYTNILSGKQ